ncbi:hypothetical protein EAV90_11485 [Bradyrhizobium vignae]|nr:hypothetical protein EAV90_11485 [Bradyrhizobium vignae]
MFVLGVSPPSLRGALATKRSRLSPRMHFLDCFAALAMTVFEVTASVSLTPPWAMMIVISSSPSRDAITPQVTLDFAPRKISPRRRANPAAAAWSG